MTVPKFKTYAESIVVPRCVVCGCKLSPQQIENADQHNKPGVCWQIACDIALDLALLDPSPAWPEGFHGNWYRDMFADWYSVDLH